MGLKNSQYDTIMREYYRTQSANKRIQDARREEAYANCPELNEIDAAIAKVSVAHVRKALAGGEASVAESREEIEALAERRGEVLENAGYPADYLELPYTCPDCKDTGYIGNEKCHCFKQKVIDLLYTQSNIRDILAIENFDTFSYQYYSPSEINPATGVPVLEEMKITVARCREFVKHFDEKKENFVFYGTTGVGKTFLTHCIAKELIDTAHSVIYFTATQFFELFSKTTFGTGGDMEELQQMHDYIFDCDLLIIDDLGTELTNAFVSSQLFMVLNERLLREKSTIISTNLSLDAIQSLYNERVLSRITGNYTMFKMVGPDIRIRKKLANRP